jgi:hypothetical protein
MKGSSCKLAVWLLGGSLLAATAQTNSLPLPPIAAGPFQPDWNSLANWPGNIGSVRLCGGGKLKFTRDVSGLLVILPQKIHR